MDINLTKKPTTAYENVDETPVTQVVRVTQLSGDVIELEYEPGTTLGEYLGRAEVTVGEGQIATVNARPVKNMQEIVEPNAIIVVAAKISNG